MACVRPRESTVLSAENFTLASMVSRVRKHGSCAKMHSSGGLHSHMRGHVTSMSLPDTTLAVMSICESCLLTKHSMPSVVVVIIYLTFGGNKGAANAGAVWAGRRAYSVTLMY